MGTTLKSLDSRREDVEFYKKVCKKLRKLEERNREMEIEIATVRIRREGEQNSNEAN